MLKHYEEFFSLISHFGMGMIIFPSLMHDLKGTYVITKVGEDLKESL